LASSARERVCDPVTVTAPELDPPDLGDDAAEVGVEPPWVVAVVFFDEPELQATSATVTVTNAATRRTIGSGYLPMPTV
jgi:hypothetical protein